VLVFSLFFLFPANLLIYGVNDIFDYETDRLNLKKAQYEALVAPAEHRRLWTAIVVVCLPFAPALMTCTAAAWAGMAAFLFFSLFYSAPPIRAKARPIWDSAFNTLYVCPGVFAYVLIGGASLSVPLLLAGAFWTAAMHAYSAAPDIAADEAVGIRTIATQFGFAGTLRLCLVLYLTSTLLSLAVLHWLAVLLAGVYAVLMVLSLRLETGLRLLGVYRWFPLVNTLSGMAIFFFLLHEKGWI
jgi:4-hydroxybenzoate polyprenyltransferase